MPDSSTGFAPSAGARIAYDTAGEGLTVVFIHAAIADRRMWGPQLAEVPAGFRFVSLDLRGHGDTELTDERFSNHEDVLAVLDHLDINEAAIVGCSMGGGTAIDVALAAPDRVSGLVLIAAASPGFETEEYEPPQWPEILEAYEAGDMSRVAELETEVWVVGLGRERDDVNPDAVDLVLEMDRALLPNEDRRDELVLPLDPPSADRIGELSVPTLVVVGEHDRPDVRQAATHLAETRSHHDVVVIPGAAHLPNLEQPEAFNRVLAGFLEAFAV
jgi:3-oxoadipate enol-lactonase